MIVFDCTRFIKYFYYRDGAKGESREARQAIIWSIGVESREMQTPPVEDGHEVVAEALDTLVTRIKHGADYSDMLHPAIKRLVQHDRDNQTDFLHTLEVYLENDCNAQKCGRLLFLHRNSLVYRIHRIEEIAGCDLSDPTERAYLRLSLLLR